MLVELSIVPLQGRAHVSDDLAEVLKLVDASGLVYQLTPSGTCIEGGWDEVMELARRCHDRIRQNSSHVITWIKIEDEEGRHDTLSHNVSSMEEKVGRPLWRKQRLITAKTPPSGN